MTSNPEKFELTDEHKAQMRPWADKWIEIGLCTDRSNREECERAYADCYRLADLKPDVPVVWVQNPLVGALSAAYLEALLESDKELDARQTCHAVTRHFALTETGIIDPANEAKSTSRLTKDIVERVSGPNRIDASWHNWLGGSFWVWWVAYESFFRKLCGLKYPGNLTERAEAYERCSLYGHYWWPNSNFIVACERPSHIRLDGENRLHGETDKAIAYPDGWGLYLWHGTEFPAEWIEKPETLTAKVALTWQNIEQRRIAAELLGWDNVLNELHAVVIDKDDDPEIGTLVEVDLPNAGRERFLRVRCGTGRQFALPVPPGVSTALEANAWTYGMDKDTFSIPEVRT